jgi:hypothetical protein
VAQHRCREVIENIEREEPGEEVVYGQEEGVRTTCLHRSMGRYGFRE